MPDKRAPSPARTLHFSGTLKSATGGGAVVEIPASLVPALGGLRQMRVYGAVNGVPYRSSTMPYREGFYLGVHKATREAAGIAFGDRLEVDITRNDSPRVLALAPELEAAFRDEPALGERFASLSFSRRRDLASPISEAKKPETRARRLDEAMARLRGD